MTTMDEFSQIAIENCAGDTTVGIVTTTARPTYLAGRAAKVISQIELISVGHFVNMSNQAVPPSTVE